MKSSAAVAVSTLSESHATAAIDEQFDVYKTSRVTKRAAEVRARVPDYVVDVSRPFVPWRWTSVLLAPLELLAVAWTIPVVILSIGIPIALVVALVYWAGRFLLTYFI